MKSFVNDNKSLVGCADAIFGTGSMAMSVLNRGPKRRAGGLAKWMHGARFVPRG